MRHPFEARMELGKNMFQMAGRFNRSPLGIPLPVKYESEEEVPLPKLKVAVDAGVIVVDAETQEPIEGATVQVNLLAFDRTQTRKTNAEGYAYFSFDVPSETPFGVKAVATVDAEGYGTEEKDIRTGIDNNRIELETGVDLTTIGIGVGIAAAIGLVLLT